MTGSGPTVRGELRDQIPPANIFVLDANGVLNPDFAASMKIGLSIIRERTRRLSEILAHIVPVPNGHGGHAGNLNVTCYCVNNFYNTEHFDITRRLVNAR